MLFNSPEFIFIFLPAVLLGFFSIAARSHRLAALWLAAASLFFYGWWNPQFVLLLLASIGFNFAMGHAIGHAVNQKSAQKHRAKSLMATAITCNLLLLGYFKYTNFFINTANGLLGEHLALANIILPLGISFFTFTQIAFIVDVYRGIAREYNFIHYLLFVTYFPHLIAGPVLHHKQMMPQFGEKTTYRLNINNINIGLTIFTIGLFKKVILADQFSLYANPIFDAVAKGSEPGLIEAWGGALAYTLQLYFDFSGYSDMAIGLSRMFNVNLPVNFNSPYKAGNIIEFWRRWHMTLSAFLRDYLYIPLGGNRHGTLRRHLNLLVTMLLGGLWHGANWTFVFWGGLHGVYLVVNHFWQALCTRLKLPHLPGGAVLSGALTFIAVVVAWVPFRADSFATAMRMIDGMFGRHGIAWVSDFNQLFPSLVAHQLELLWGLIEPAHILRYSIMWFALGMLIIWRLPNAQQWIHVPTDKESQPSGRYWKPGRLTAVIMGLAFAMSVLAFKKNSPFLYFQF